MLDPKTRELVAVGASVVANCQPCLDHHLQEARNAGASDREIADAVGLARMVRKAGAEKMDTHVGEAVGGRVPDRSVPSACCGSGKGN